ncbi:MAG: hypothetical protein ACKOW8_14985, partial [Flavobacteriales bacterium]
MIRLIIVAGISVLFYSCADSTKWLSISTPVENSKWLKDDALNMSFEVDDTIRLFDFFIDVRHDDRYNYSNLYVFVDMSFPNGKVSTDTLELTLADA